MVGNGAASGGTMFHQPQHIGKQMTKNKTIRLIREPECLHITGLSRTSRWRLEGQGKFPKRHKITEGTVGWVESDVLDWVEERCSHAA